MTIAVVASSVVDTAIVQCTNLIVAPESIAPGE